MSDARTTWALNESKEVGFLGTLQSVLITQMCFMSLSRATASEEVHPSDLICPAVSCHISHSCEEDAIILSLPFDMANSHSNCTVLAVCLVLLILDYAIYPWEIILPSWRASMEISSDERLAKLALWNLVAADGVNITGDVDFLLDYAIIGHPKTATTFTNLWFQTHPQVRSFREEINEHGR